MFKELDNLSERDFIAVCHAASHMWFGSFGAFSLLPDKLKPVAEDFVKKHDKSEFEKLDEYYWARLDLPAPKRTKSSRVRIKYRAAPRVERQLEEV